MLPILLFCLPGVIHAEQSFGKMSSEQLIKEADRCIRVKNDSLTKRTLQCLNEVTKRYYAAPADKQARLYGVQALRRLSNVYMTYSIDYKQAYKTIRLAFRIAEEDGITEEMPFIYLSLTNLYYINSNPSNSDHLKPLAADALKNALDFSMRTDNARTLTAAVNNLVLVSLNSPDYWDICKPEIDKVKKYRFPKPSNEVKLTKLLISGIERFKAGKPQDAVNTIIDAKKYISNDAFAYRTVYSIDLMAIGILMDAADYDRAIQIAKQSLDNARENGHPDYEMTFYSNLANLYNLAQRPDSADKYRSKYLEMRSLLEESANLNSVETMNFLDEIEKINKEVEDLSIQRQRHRIILTILISGILLLLLLLGALLIIYRRERRHNSELFAQREEANKRDFRNDLLRREMESEINKLREQVKAGTSPAPSPESQEQEEQKDPENDADTLLLYNRILSYVGSHDEIYEPGYNMDTLARALKTSSANISHAINALHNCNFRQFLNEYRINRACSLMSDPGNDGYTIESIAERVGIKSRTSFATMFKKATGLTPTAYWEIAKGKRKHA